MSKLKEIREKVGLTQEQLSQISEVTVETIKNYEKGSENINEASIKTLFSLSKALRCNLEVLLEIEKFQDPSKNKLCTGKEVTAENLQDMVENHFDFAAQGATKHELDIACRVIYQGYDDSEEDIERLIKELRSQYFDRNIDLKIIGQIAEKCPWERTDDWEIGNVGEKIRWRWMEDRERSGIYDVRYSRYLDLKEKVLEFNSEFSKWLKHDPAIKSMTIDCSSGYGQGFMSESFVLKYFKIFKTAEEMDLDMLLYISDDEIRLQAKRLADETQLFAYLFQKFSFHKNEDFFEISCHGKQGDISIIFNYDDSDEDIVNLKKYREKANLSQSQLAEKSGVSVKMIQKYEQCDRDIKKAAVETVHKLSIALNCTIEELIQ